MFLNDQIWVGQTEFGHNHLHPGFSADGGLLVVIVLWHATNSQSRKKLIDHFSRFLPFVKINGGREGRPIGAYELAKAVEELGAGEILLNCIDCDGEDSYFSTLNHFFRKYSMTEFFF
jgi:hypothetical protein